MTMIVVRGQALGLQIPVKNAFLAGGIVPSISTYTPSSGTSCSTQKSFTWVG
ncbi:MAG: hypothetical protein WCW44_01265 [archaeon]